MNLPVDLKITIHYAFAMDTQPPQTEPKATANPIRRLAPTLLRFILAGIIASVITFFLLFVMRYLIVGYDNSATGAITRYFTLKTIKLPDKEERRLRVERPSEEPEFSGMAEPDFNQESAAFPDEQNLDVPEPLSSAAEIEKDIQLPQLEVAPLSTQEKLRQIKQHILSEEN